MAENQKSLKSKIHQTIFSDTTVSGKRFDLALLWAIAISVILVMMESVKELREQFGNFFYYAEWFFTILFTIEYVLRIWTLKKPLKYIFSFYGVVDLLSLLPSYIGLWVTDSSSLRVIRILRLLRIFRVLRLFSFLKEAEVVKRALIDSRAKITVFLFFVLSMVVILGTTMYIIESPETGFTSIPRSIYWAIVTITTVGYGDIAPATPLGQMLASIVMLMGYVVIAVPTGIVTAEITKNNYIDPTDDLNACESCGEDYHADDAEYCRKCGNKLGWK